VTTSPLHGVDDLAQFRGRLAELRAALDPPPAGPGAYQVHTDGACQGNPDGPGGWAAVVQHVGSGATWELWGHLSSTSNNRAEALGVLAAVEWVPAGSTVLLRSDSQLTLNQLAGRWKVKANGDIWADIRQTVATKELRITPEWVRGHAGDPGNERADALSVLGAVRGDAARAEQLRVDAAGRRPADAGAAVPAELVGVEPRGPWEIQFVASIAKTLRSGRPLSERQLAVLDRIRARPA